MLETIGRYEIEEELGRGGMAVVYRARDPYTKRQVAIKLLSGDFARDPLFRNRFQREAEVLATLEHSCIVPIFDFGAQEEDFYIVMRHMAGGSLADRLEEGRIKLRTLATIVERVARALDTAHVKEIIHRDLKPANVLFDNLGEAALSDFGIAQTTHPSTGLTGTLMFGTPEYMSPEQVRNEELDGRSDVYALGCMIYRTLTGRVPYEEGSVLATALAHVTHPVPRVSEHRAHLPDVWDEIVARAMAKDPADRYPTAGALAREVEEAAAGRWFFRKLAD